MDKILVLTLLLSVFVFSSCKKDKPVIVSGEVFIIARDGQKVKLDRLTVIAVPANAMKGFTDGIKPSVDKKRGEIVERIKNCNSSQLREHCRELNRIDLEVLLLDFVTLHHLPNDATFTDTDSEGKYLLALPKPGKYVIVSRSTQKAVDSTKYYYWAVNVETSGEPKEINLTNDNQIISNSLDLAIKFDLSKYKNPASLPAFSAPPIVY